MSVASGRQRHCSGLRLLSVKDVTQPFLSDARKRNANLFTGYVPVDITATIYSVSQVTHVTQSEGVGCVCKTASSGCFDVGGSRTARTRCSRNWWAVVHAGFICQDNKRVSDRDSSKREDLVTRPHRQRISETTAAAAAATATLGVLSQLQRRQQLTDHILMMPLSFAPRDR